MQSERHYRGSSFINSYLNSLKSKALDIQEKLIHKNQELSIQNFKEFFLGSEEKQKLLVPIFQDHNNKIRELVGKGYALGTFEGYTTSLKHTIEF